jgi:hypothetical protein
MVSQLRRRLGLPSNRDHPRRRARAAAQARRPLEKAGAASLAELRALRLREAAAAAGWPDALTPCQARILDLLHARGPLTRREIASLLGRRWGGLDPRTAPDRGFSDLALLNRLGLAVVIGAVAGRRKGSEQAVYSLPLWLQKGVFVPCPKN